MYVYYCYATPRALSPRPLVIATHMHTCAAKIWKSEIRARL